MMSIRTPRLVLAAVAALLLLPASRPAFAQERTVEVRDAWVRVPLGARTVTAAYAVVENHGATPLAITAVSSPVAGKGELHEMKMIGQKMEMSPVTRVPMPAQGKAELRPGGFHVMLFDLKRPLRDGETVDLTLTFDNGTSATVVAMVRSEAPDGAADRMPMKMGK